MKTTFRGFLSIGSFSSTLHFVGIRVFIVGYEIECEKSILSNTRYSGDLASRLEQVASLSRKLTTRSDCTFCPIVLQLS